MSKPVYFKDAAALRKWFSRNARRSSELLVGYMKRGTGGTGSLCRAYQGPFRARVL